MSELRWHPLLGEWVTVAPWRQERTYHPASSECPLCPTRPGGPPTEIPAPDYHIAVFENRFPSYAADPLGRPGGPPVPLRGRLDPEPPLGGRCEVVCYTADHDTSLGDLPLDHIRDLVEVWRDRCRDLGRLPDVRYVFVFENRGEEIGVTLSHPHGQVYAYPFVPPLVERELRRSAGHWRATRRCLYCDVLAAETGDRTVTGDARWLAFVPAFARWPFEVHLAPRGHRTDLLELDDPECDSLAAVLKDLLMRYDRLFHRRLPYVMAVHARPPGRGHRHHHLHIEFYPPNRTVDRLKFLAGSELGAGAFILDAAAEETARRLREA